MCSKPTAETPMYNSIILRNPDESNFIIIDNLNVLLLRGILFFWKTNPFLHHLN